eukprot:92667-Pleurochrysis_carterae.AAC.2
MALSMDMAAEMSERDDERERLGRGSCGAEWLMPASGGGGMTTPCLSAEDWIEMGSCVALAKNMSALAAFSLATAEPQRASSTRGEMPSADVMAARA